MTWGRFIMIQDSQKCMATRSYCSRNDCYTLLYNWQLWRYCFVFSLKIHQQLSCTARSVPVNNLFITVNTPTWLDLICAQVFWYQTIYTFWLSIWTQHLFWRVILFWLESHAVGFVFSLFLSFETPDADSDQMFLPPFTTFALQAW